MHGYSKVRHNSYSTPVKMALDTECSNVRLMKEVTSSYSSMVSTPKLKHKKKLTNNY